MDNVHIGVILDRGAKYIGGNHPDNLSKRIALAWLLVDLRLVRTVDAGILAFKMWALPQSRKHDPLTIVDLANRKVKE